VGEDDRLEPTRIFQNVGEIRKEKVHTGEVALWEFYSGVDEDERLPPPDESAVHPESTYAAEGDEAQSGVDHFQPPLMLHSS